MEMKHTPGPWAYIKPDGYTVRHHQIYSDTGPVCNATLLGDGRLDEHPSGIEGNPVNHNEARPPKKGLGIEPEVGA